MISTAVVFDFGGVLAKTQSIFSADLEKDLGITHSFLTDFINQHYSHLQKGLIAESDFWSLMLGEISSSKLECIKKHKRLIRNQLHYNWDLIQIIDNASQFESFLLSNTSPLYDNSVTTSIIESTFHKCYLSYEIGYRKPEPESYDKIILDLEGDFENIVFVDDQLANLEYPLMNGYGGILHVSNSSTSQKLKLL